MAIVSAALFSGRGDLSDVLRRGLTSVPTLVDRLDEKLFATLDDSELLAKVVSHSSIMPLEVNFDKATSNVNETAVDLPDGFGGYYKATHLLVTKTFSFKGEPSLWYLTPDVRSGLPKGNVEQKTVSIEVSVPENDIDNVEGLISLIIAQIKKCIADQSVQLEKYSEDLSATALPLIQQRRNRLAQKDKLLKRLEGGREN